MRKAADKARLKRWGSPRWHRDSEGNVKVTFLDGEPGHDFRFTCGKRGQVYIDGVRVPPLVYKRDKKILDKFEQSRAERRAMVNKVMPPDIVDEYKTQFEAEMLDRAKPLRMRIAIGTPRREDESNPFWEMCKRNREAEVGLPPVEVEPHSDVVDALTYPLQSPWYTEMKFSKEMVRDD